MAKRYKVCPDIIWRLEGETVLAFNRATTLAYQLNEESAALLELCDGSRDEERLRSDFAEATGRQDLGRDLDSFCRQLCEMGILTAEDGGESGPGEAGTTGPGARLVGPDEVAGDGSDGK